MCGWNTNLKPHCQNGFMFPNIWGEHLTQFKTESPQIIML